MKMVKWEETDQHALQETYERAKTDAAFRESFKGQDFQAPMKLVIAEVLSIAYQQEQVSMDIAQSGRSYTERVKSQWKMLVAIQGTGEIREIDPTTVKVFP